MAFGCTDSFSCSFRFVCDYLLKEIFSTRKCPLRLLFYFNSWCLGPGKTGFHQERGRSRKTTEFVMKVMPKTLNSFPFVSKMKLFLKLLFPNNSRLI